MKRGSALLIVLGMVSFMVISAVGFSIYMRESRVPSSHLRREASSRYLLKSALANAIARLDGEVVDLGPEGFDDRVGQYALEGVYDDVYPGLTAETLQDEDNGDLWNHRVFTPFGACNPIETVSTLTLEGLAYIPPAIINEARVFSRTTRTARWHNLAYDVGRYAFCALDVSDCFDVNKVTATGRRTSAAGSRVSLEALYPNDGSALDDLFGKADQVPFVSVADFNIAAGNTKFSPFVKYIGATGAKIYTTGDAASVSNALFITDTWFPETNDYLTVQLERKARATAGYDLSKASDQPFNDFEAQSFMHVTDQTRFSRAGGIGMCNLGMVGLACLYDYLDGDSVPISYCLPCAETAPMACGLGVIFQDQFKLAVKLGESVIGQHQTGVDPTTGSAVFEDVKATKATLEIPAMKLPVKAVLSFPFKRTSIRTGESKPGNYTVKAVAKIFFAPADLRCRLDQNSPVYPATKDDWSAGYKDGVLTVVCDSFTGSLAPKDLPTTEDTLFDLHGFFQVGAQSLPLYWKVEKSIPSGSSGSTSDPQKYYSRDVIAADQGRLRVFGKEGVIEDAWEKVVDKGAKGDMPKNGTKWSDADLPTVAKENLGDDLLGTEVVPHVAVWLRIEQNGNVVDIVPARPADDVLWGQRANVVTSGKSLQLCGEDAPILDFRGTLGFKVGTSAETALPGDKSDPFAWKQMYAVDPRFNWAPENWFAVTGGDGDAKKEEWMQSVVSGFLGQDGRDKDVFMFTSDQEYLQSIGELQFIPLVQRTTGGASFNGDWLEKVRYSGDPFDNRSVAAGGAVAGLPFACKDFMWRTYCAYDRSNAGGWANGWDSPYELRDNGGKIVSVIAGTGDFRLNPFALDTRIHSAAVLDTPYDYYVASTNESCNGLAADADGRTLAFGVRGRFEQWDDIDVADLAACLRDAFHDVAKDGIHDYTQAMYDLAWDDVNEKRIFNMEEDLADPLHSVDRKFLFSYWRECFQNRQQLFLVFIRAEPLTVGGSTGGALANSQLGARGVALVWRDPSPPSTKAGGQKRKGRTSLTNRADWRKQGKSSGAHRIRILFYHQFD